MRRWWAGLLVLVLTTPGCSVLGTSDGRDPTIGSTASSGPSGSGTGIRTGSSPRITPATTEAAGADPYSLDIPADHGDLSRVEIRDGRQTQRRHGSLRAGTVERLAGACIFGVDDQATVVVHQIDSDATNPGTQATVSFPCDGARHVRSVRLYVTTPVLLSVEPVGPKTYGWAAVLASGRPR